MLYLDEIKKPLKKVLEAMDKDRSLLIKYTKSTPSDDKRITAENLGDLAGNHLFDDNPELFGISKIEGHKIRAYFQMTDYLIRKSHFVFELHKEFPDLMEPEREEYIQRIEKEKNTYRNIKRYIRKKCFT